MGISDIFYNELNRLRDATVSEEDKKNAVKKALMKSLSKFRFLWEDQMLTGAYKRNEIYPQIGIFSDEFLDLAVEVDSILNDEEIANRLREISTLFRIVSKSPHPFGGYFDNPIPTEIGQALTKMKEIKEKIM